MKHVFFKVSLNIDNSPSLILSDIKMIYTYIYIYILSSPEYKVGWSTTTKNTSTFIQDQTRTMSNINHFLQIDLLKIYYLSH